MIWWSLVLGSILVLWAFIEALWTALWIDGNSAPLTSRLTTWVWKGFRLLSPAKNHRFLSLSGPVILFLTVAVWIMLLWIGWALIFHADPGSLKDTRNNTPPTFAGVLWYIGYTLFTVGNGDFAPQGSLWKIVSGVVAFSGMSAVTLSITYLLQVLSAVVNKRALAAQVLDLGKSAEELLIAQWDGKAFTWVEVQLNTWSSQLSRLTEQTLAYPILHYYHAAHAEKSSAVALAVLDEALSVIVFGVEKRCRPAPAVLVAMRQSIHGYLDTMQSAFISPADQVPGSPDLGRLREQGIPVVEDAAFGLELEKLQQRRQLLQGMIDNAAWQWPLPKKR